jgi:hypothetical protein
MPQIQMTLPRPILSSHALPVIGIRRHPPCVKLDPQRDFMTLGAKDGGIDGDGGGEGEGAGDVDGGGAGDGAENRVADSL